jgi:hypothetical protein
MCFPLTLLFWTFGVTESVLVPEGSDRIGGQIHSLEWGGEGEYVECGAQWVHVIETHCKNAIANDMNLLDDPSDYFLESSGEKTFMIMMVY